MISSMFERGLAIWAGGSVVGHWVAVGGNGLGVAADGGVFGGNFFDFRWADRAVRYARCF